MIIGICDDNEREHPYLMQLCNLHGIHNFLHYYSGEELLHTDKLPELLFLDIEMPGIDGMDVMRKFELLPSSPYIIFYTAHVELLPDAFGKKVIGFLHKPISAREMKKCLIRTQSLLTMDGFITFEGNKKVYYKEILYIESSKNYTIFHPMKGEAIFSRITMAEWLVQHLVNKSAINRMHFLAIYGIIKSYTKGEILYAIYCNNYRTN